MTEFIDQAVGSGSVNVKLDGGATPHYAPDDNIPFDGALRVNGSEVEYYNAKACRWSTWHGATLSVEILPVYESALWWAVEEKQKAEQLEEKMKKFPSLRLAKENFDMVKALVENDK
jgi:hypothetical protein